MAWGACDVVRAISGSVMGTAAGVETANAAIVVVGVGVMVDV